MSANQQYKAGPLSYVLVFVLVVVLGVVSYVGNRLDEQRQRARHNIALAYEDNEKKTRMSYTVSTYAASRPLVIEKQVKRGQQK